MLVSLVEVEDVDVLGMLVVVSRDTVDVEGEDVLGDELEVVAVEGVLGYAKDRWLTRLK